MLQLLDIYTITTQIFCRSDSYETIRKIARNLLESEKNNNTSHRCASMPEIVISYFFIFRVKPLLFDYLHTIYYV